MNSRRYTRKSFLATLGLAAGAAPLFAAERPRNRGVGPGFKGPLGLQLYSLRDSFKSDVPGSMKKVANFGFQYAELAGTYGMAPDKFLALLKENGITAVSGHFGYEMWRDKPEAAVAEARALGLKYAGCAWIPHTSPFDEKQCRAAAATFNNAGKVAAAQGIRFFYHVHGYEFEKHGDGTLLDLLFQETDPKTVAYQMDIFWVVFPGQDPVKLLEKYTHRWELMHLKDMKQGVKLGSLTGGTDVSNDVAIGAGQIQFVPLLRAAKKAGVKFYFIEDESPSVMTQIPESLRFLETIRL